MGSRESGALGWILEPVVNFIHLVDFDAALAILVDHQSATIGTPAYPYCMIIIDVNAERPPVFGAGELLRAPEENNSICKIEDCGC